MIRHEKPLGESHLKRAAQISATIAELSAVPSTWWCEEAAQTLNQVLPSSVVSLTIADFETNGTIRDLIAQSTYVPETIEVTRASGSTIDKTRLRSLNWWMQTSSVLVAMLSGLSTNQQWLSSAAGSQWASYNVETMIVGLGRLSGDTTDRFVAVEFGVPEGHARPTDADASLLRALMPVFVARASTTFGDPNLVMVTAREVEVLKQLAVGKSVKQIAGVLDRSEHTIHDHVKSLHRKLNASSRGELIARALGRLGSQPIETVESFPITPQIETTVKSITPATHRVASL